MLAFRFVWVFCALILISFQSALPVSAHRQAESYVFFSVTDENLTGRIEATLSDINRLVPLDADGDDVVTQQEFEARSDEVFSFFADRLSIVSEGKTYAISPLGNDFLKVGFGTFAQLSFEVDGLSPTPDAVDVRYVPLTDASNPGHLGFGLIENNTRTGVTDNETHISMIFDGSGESQSLSLIGDPWYKVFVDFVVHGVWHIWIGLDHILFLFTLLLPAVLLRKDGSWQAVGDFKTAFINVIKIATVFTLAHSVTLSLAALNIISLPSTLVEAIIALSIAVVALGNMFPVFHHRVLLIVFAFGLFHGFGFANVLEPLGVAPGNKVVGLAGFNIGVELGQIAIIIVLFPVLFMLRRMAFYPFAALKLGSVVIILIAGFWIVERTAVVFTKVQQQLFAML